MKQDTYVNKTFDSDLLRTHLMVEYLKQPPLLHDNEKASRLEMNDVIDGLLGDRCLIRKMPILLHRYVGLIVLIYIFHPSAFLC